MADKWVDEREAEGTDDEGREVIGWEEEEEDARIWRKVRRYKRRS